MRLIGALFIVVFLAACGRTPLTQQESFVFGTRVEVLVYGVPAEQAKPAITAVLQEFDRLHRSYHAWQPSELTSLNAALAAGRRHTVSAELDQLLRDAQALSLRSRGLFDPGIGGLIALWGFHSESYTPRLPEANALAAWRRAAPGIADLSIHADHQVSSRKCALAIDFGGYLKGVALDRAAALLRMHGIDNALINIGGNILALGSKGGQAWRVGIQHPRASGTLATLELQDGEAIGTSGDYQRYFELDGVRYSHLLDPRSAAPSSVSQALSVLVTAGEAGTGQAGMYSDGLSKPLFLAGDGWREEASRLGLGHVLRIDPHGKVEASPAMRARLKFDMEVAP